MTTTKRLLSTFESLIRSKKRDANEIVGCLNQLLRSNNFDGNHLIELFENLLFLIAYPCNQKVLNLALKSFLTLEKRKQNQILKSKASYHSRGIPSSQIEARFTFEIVNWFFFHYPKNIHSLGSEARDSDWRETLMLLLPAIISEEFENSFNSYKDWLQNMAPKDELQFLIHLIGRSNLPPKLKEHFFYKLNLFVSITLPESNHWLLPKKNYAQTKPFFHHQIEKFNPQDLGLLDIPLDEINLNYSDKQELENRARITLLSFQRETDPITFSQTDELRYFNLGRGFTLALFQLRRDLQLGIDVYIGYMAFKNNIPAAYGGAWLFDERAKLGINIFPFMRGGESNYLFARLISTYQAIGNLAEFTVEPYQIGKDNEDGIKSGAFWFYYKFGFRPQELSLKKIADAEFEKISKIPNYKTSQKTLKILAESNLILSLKKTKNKQYDSGLINKKISSLVTKHFNGSASKAEEYILKKLKFTLPSNELSGQLLLLLPLLMQNKLSKAARVKACIFISILSEGKDLSYHYYFQNFDELKNAMTIGSYQRLVK